MHAKPIIVGRSAAIRSGHTSSHAGAESGEALRYTVVNLIGNAAAFGIDSFGLGPAVLVYCGYIGGLSEESADGIAVNGIGNACITAVTNFTRDSFPVAGGPDLTFNDTEYIDALVAKVGTAVLDKQIYVPPVTRGD